MLEHAKRWMSCLVALVALATATSCTSTDEKGFARAEGEIVHTRVNLWCAPGRKTSSANYHQGSRLPAGTKVRITGREANAMSFMTTDGAEYTLVLNPRMTPISLDELVSRLFSRTDVLGPGQPSELFTPEEMENVEKGTVACGMTKEAVLMAYGYPPGNKTPDLSGDTWYYWPTARSRTPSELKFKHNRLFSIDGRIGRQTVRLYAVSDPSGAAIEVDGAFAGKAPCVLALTVDPETPGRTWRLRATPAKPDVPRLGVICGMPVGGPALGEYITVSDVLPLSTAHKLGVKKGDQIVSIAGALVRSDRECFDVVKNLGFNREIAMVVRRGLGEIKLKGRTEEIEAGELHVQEKLVSALQLLDMDQKAVVFDMRERPVGVAPAVSRAAPSPAQDGVRTRPVDPVRSRSEETRVEPKTLPADPGGTESVAEAIAAAGSGVVVGKGGYVLTCAHILTGARTIKVRTAVGTESEARVVKSDAGNDWCILKAEGLDAAPVPWTERRAPEKGAKLFCLGYPVEKATAKARPAPVVRTGSVLESAGLDGDARHMQAALAINEGYSGACLLDSRGRLVGMVSDRLNNLIQAVAPRGAVTAGTVFVQKTEIIEALLPGEVHVERAADSREGEVQSADEMARRRAGSVVMIRVWR